jgi:DNA-binding transcriptional MocR family regulator
MPDDRKQQLVEMLARYDIPLIEDDMEGDLYFGSTRPRSAKVFDRTGLVLLCSSFSKTLGPGYRVGWCAPGRYQKRVECLKFVTNTGSSIFIQETIADFLQNGSYDRHLRRIRKAYLQQVQRMTQAICNYFPNGTRSSRPTGGYVLWVELPENLDTLELQRRALAARVSIAPGPIFSARAKYHNFLRINCGYPWSQSLEQGIATLGCLMRENVGR